MKATIAILSVFSAVLFFGWVIPDVPYIRRMKAEEATALFNEYKKLYIQNWSFLWIPKTDKKKLTPAEAARMEDLRFQLILAGYSPEININLSTGDIWAGLNYPKYADKSGNSHTKVIDNTVQK